MHPTSKVSRKRSPAQRLKRKIRKVFAKRKAAAKPAPPAEPVPPRVRLPGAVLETLQVKCADVVHPLYVVRLGHATKAIITPCGLRATVAAYNLGGDTCGRVVELLLNELQGRITRDKPEVLIDEQGLILRAVGDSAAMQAQTELRRRRRERAASVDIWAAERRALVTAALPKLVARAAGPGAEVWFDGRRCYIQIPGQEVPSCYLYDTGSWGVGPGPQAPDAVWSMLKRWATMISSHALSAQHRGISMMTPGYRPF